jgi:hypothetical protein
LNFLSLSTTEITSVDIIIQYSETQIGTGDIVRRAHFIDANALNASQGIGFSLAIGPIGAGIDLTEASTVNVLIHRAPSNQLIIDLKYSSQFQVTPGFGLSSRGVSSTGSKADYKMGDQYNLMSTRIAF